MNIDFATFLTNKDREVVFKYYGTKKPWMKFPIMVEDPLKSKVKYHFEDRGNLKIIFSGSLDYYPNKEAALFLDNNSRIIRNIFRETIEIIVAGRSPNRELKDCQNVRTIANPSTEILTTLMLNSDLFVPPVFQGSGVKIKVIDALSHGLPIVTSYHSLIGYENIIDKAYIFPFRDRDIRDFESALRKVRKLLDEKDKKEIFQVQREVFKKYFSIENAEKILWKILEKITRETNPGGVGR